MGWPMERDRKNEDEARPRGVRGWLARGWHLMHNGGSAGWLITTVLQALLTWGFMGIAKLAEGFPWEPQAKMLVIVAFVATWCMALRTIRARLLELIRFWRKSSDAVTRKAPMIDEQKAHFFRSFQKTYVRQSIFRLRVIAAGITMPFFILPIFTASVCVALSCSSVRADHTGLLGMALVLSVLAAIVGAYFHWTVVPHPVRATAPASRSVRIRRRRRPEV